MPVHLERGEFFIIPASQFFRIYIAGLGVPVMAVYLVLAMGTGKDNRFSKCGKKAIRQKTGLSENTVNWAISELEAINLIKALPDAKSTTKRFVDRYEIIHPNPLAGLKGKELEIVRKISVSGQPDTEIERQAAYRALKKGRLMRRNKKWFLPRQDMDKIFLPNALIGTGQAFTHFRNLVDADNPDAFSLLIQYYHIYDLKEHAGINPKLLHFKCRVVPKDETIEFKGGNLFEISRSEIHLNQDFPWKCENVPEAHQLLVNLGFVDCAIYSYRQRSLDSKIAFDLRRPLGLFHKDKAVRNVPESSPSFLSFAVHAYLHSPIPPRKENLIPTWLDTENTYCIEADHIKTVSAIGIFRPHYIARTEKMVVWHDEICKKSEEFVFFLQNHIVVQNPQLVNLIKFFINRPESKYATSSRYKHIQPP